jgi:hypothetical protein
MVVLGIFLTLVFLVSLVSKRAQKSIVTAPMLFTLAGILMVLTFSEFSQVEIKGHSILVLGEITLAVVLFTDATRISLSQDPGRYGGHRSPVQRFDHLGGGDPGHNPGANRCQSGCCCDE